MKGKGWFTLYWTYQRFRGNGLTARQAWTIARELIAAEQPSALRWRTNGR